MNVKEFGKENKDVIILLHGGGFSWWNYKKSTEILAKKYHVVLPLLDGHAGSDRAITSLKDNADEIIKYIDENFNGKVLCIGGVSYGGQILVEILTQRSDICSHAIIESASVVPYSTPGIIINLNIKLRNSKLGKNMLKKMYTKCKYEELSGVDFETYFNSTSSLNAEDLKKSFKVSSQYALNEEKFKPEAELCVLVGSKEGKTQIMSAEKLNKAAKNSRLFVLENYQHAQASFIHGEEYAERLEKLVAGTL